MNELPPDGRSLGNTATPTDPTVVARLKEQYKEEE
jgi:hypothetical protein